jgi:hypothetical protein
MLDNKLARIKELLDTKEKVDAELAALIAGTEPPKKRGRKPKAQAQEPPPPMVE